MSFISNTRSFSDINVVENPDIFKRSLNKFASDVFDAINARVIGTYSAQVSLSGQTFNGAQGQRVVVPFTTIPNGPSVLSTPISAAASPSSPLTITALYGTAQNGSICVPIPYVNVLAPSDGITLSMTLSGPSVTLLTTTANWVGYHGFIVIEFIYA